jgi:hypothetical protein
MGAFITKLIVDYHAKQDERQKLREVLDRL